MEEKLYIESTNLCKLRIARRILVDCYTSEEYGIAKDEHLSVIINIDVWISELEKCQNN